MLHIWLIISTETATRTISTGQICWGIKVKWQKNLV